VRGEGRGRGVRTGNTLNMNVSEYGILTRVLSFFLSFGKVSSLDNCLWLEAELASFQDGCLRVVLLSPCSVVVRMRLQDFDNVGLR
jgi:hypothetical protein